MGSLRTKVREYLARRLNVPEIPFALERLAATGFKPTRVFDVGAYRGDFAKLCLRIWPDCHVACFEPLPDKVKELTELAGQAAIRVVPGLLGAQVNQSVAIHEMETASSVLEEH